MMTILAILAILLPFIVGLCGCAFLEGFRGAAIWLICMLIGLAIASIVTWGAGQLSGQNIFMEIFKEIQHAQ